MKFIRVLKANDNIQELVDSIYNYLFSHLAYLKEIEYDNIQNDYYIENEKEFREDGDYSLLKIVVPEEDILPAINKFLNDNHRYSIDDLFDLLNSNSSEAQDFEHFLYEEIRPYYIYGE